MGLGETLMEESAFRKGLHKIPSMLYYMSPTTVDTPEIETILIETIDPEGQYGAKGAGQGPLLPVPPAVANAVLTMSASASTRCRSRQKKFSRRSKTERWSRILSAANGVKSRAFVPRNFLASNTQSRIRLKRRRMRQC